MPTTKAARAPKAPKGTPVTLRRSAGGGGVAKGTYVLILNPKVFGSTGENWLGGKSYPTRDAALAAAKVAGAVVQNPPKAA